MMPSTTPQVCVSDLREIQIPNWKRFNPRPDRANFSWFRMENDFFHDQRIFLLSNEQKLIYLFILCQASKKNTETVKISPRYVSAVVQLSVEQVESSFKYLADLELIKLTDFHTPLNPVRPNAGVMPAESRHDDGLEPSNSLTTLRNETRRDDTKENYNGPFEELYALFPKRRGSHRKADAFRTYRSKFHTEESRTNLRKAVENYAKHVRADGQEGTPYVAQFKTFVNSIWEEWVNPPPALLLPALKNGHDPNAKTQAHNAALERFKARHANDLDGGVHDELE